MLKSYEMKNSPTGNFFTKEIYIEKNFGHCHNFLKLFLLEENVKETIIFKTL